MPASLARLLAAALLLASCASVPARGAAPCVDAPLDDAAAPCDLDLHGCTSTTRCTGVRVAPNGAGCTQVDAWYVDEEDRPTVSTTICP